MIGDRIIVVPVDALGLLIKLFGENSQQHKHIGLFADTVLLDRVDAQKALVGILATVILALIERLQIKEAIKLLKEAALRISAAAKGIYQLVAASPGPFRRFV